MPPKPAKPDAFHDIYHTGQIQLLKRLQGIGGAGEAEG